MYGEDENAWKDYITKEKMNTEQIFVQQCIDICARMFYFIQYWEV